MKKMEKSKKIDQNIWINICVCNFFCRFWRIFLMAFWALTEYAKMQQQVHFFLLFFSSFSHFLSFSLFSL